MNTRRARSLALLPLLLTLMSVYSGLGMVWQDFSFTAAQTELSFWGRGDYEPPAPVIARTGDVIEQLLRASPRNPEFLTLKASYAVWRSYWATDLKEREALSLRALDSQYSALKSRPAHRQSWSKMVEYAARTRGGAAMRDQAESRKNALTPPSMG